MLLPRLREHLHSVNPSARDQPSSRRRGKREELVNRRRAASILERVGGPKDPLTRIIAKNIGANVSAVEVRELFSEVGGKVKKVAAVLGATGMSAAYEIDFEDEAAARNALSLDQMTLDGRRLSLSLVPEEAKKNEPQMPIKPKPKDGKAAANLLASALDKANSSVLSNSKKGSTISANKKVTSRYVAIDVTK